MASRRKIELYLSLLLVPFTLLGCDVSRKVRQDCRMASPNDCIEAFDLGQATMDSAMQKMAEGLVQPGMMQAQTVRLVKLCRPFVSTAAVFLWTGRCFT